MFQLLAGLSIELLLSFGALDKLIYYRLSILPQEPVHFTAMRLIFVSKQSAKTSVLEALEELTLEHDLTCSWSILVIVRTAPPSSLPPPSPIFCACSFGLSYLDQMDRLGQDLLMVACSLAFLVVSLWVPLLAWLPVRLFIKLLEYFCIKRACLIWFARKLPASISKAASFFDHLISVLASL